MRSQALVLSPGPSSNQTVGSVGKIVRDVETGVGAEITVCKDSVSRTVELSLPREIETLRFCRQKLIEHKSALKTVPGEDNEVDVRINAYRPNPDSVRIVSANPPEDSAQARNRGTSLKPVSLESITNTVNVEVVKLAELGLFESASVP